MPRKIEVGTGTVGRRGPYLHLVGKVMRQDGIRSPRPELRPIQGQLQKIIHVKYRGPAAVHAGKVYGKIRHPAGNRRKVQRRKLPESGTVVTEHLPQHGIDGGSDLEKGAAPAGKGPAVRLQTALPAKPAGQARVCVHAGRSLLCGNRPFPERVLLGGYTSLRQGRTE